MNPLVSFVFLLVPMDIPILFIIILIPLRAFCFICDGLLPVLPPFFGYFKTVILQDLYYYYFRNSYFYLFGTNYYFVSLFAIVYQYYCF